MDHTLAKSFACKIMTMFWLVVEKSKVMSVIDFIINLINNYASRIMVLVNRIQVKIINSALARLIVSSWVKYVTPFLTSKNKFKLAITLAFLFVLTQAWLLNTIITSRELKLDESKRIRISSDFVSARSNAELLSDLQLLKPQQNTPPPPSIDQDFDKQSNKSSEASIAVNLGNVGSIDVKLGSGIGAGEGEYIPIVKVAPIYPQGALQRGVEGYCVVEYTVSEIGTVKDSSVVPGECSSSLFESASVNASLKFKYKPRVVDGVAVEVVGVRNRFTYSIEK